MSAQPRLNFDTCQYLPANRECPRTSPNCPAGKCVVAHGYEDFWGGFVLRAGVVTMAKAAANQARSWIRSESGIPAIKVHKREVLKARDARAILDEQNLTCFDYCPDCGSAINWDAITVEYRG